MKGTFQRSDSLDIDIYGELYHQCSCPQSSEIMFIIFPWRMNLLFRFKLLSFFTIHKSGEFIKSNSNLFYNHLRISI